MSTEQCSVDAVENVITTGRQVALIITLDLRHFRLVYVTSGRSAGSRDLNASNRPRGPSLAAMSGEFRSGGLTPSQGSRRRRLRRGITVPGSDTYRG